MSEELAELRSLIENTKHLLIQYPDRLSLKMNLEQLERREKELSEREGVINK